MARRIERVLSHWGIRRSLVILNNLLIFIHLLSEQVRHLVICKAVGLVKDGFNAKTQKHVFKADPCEDHDDHEGHEDW